LTFTLHSVRGFAEPCRPGGGSEVVPGLVEVEMTRSEVVEVEEIEKRRERRRGI
jgi:hypothetical protein